MADTQSNWRSPAVPMSPDAATVQQDSETMERELIFGMIKSLYFYRVARELICPYDPLRKSHRPDFRTVRYNTLYRATDSYWRRFDHLSPQQDTSIPPMTLSAYIVDWGNKNHIAMEECLQLAKEIRNEIPLLEEIYYDSSMALVNSEGFTTWLERRVLDHAAGRIAAQKMAGLLTMDNLEETMRKAKQSIVKTRSDSFVNGGNMLLGSRKFFRAIPCDLTGINQAIGGGFRRKEASLFAAINGGGKTILALQMAAFFARNGLRTAFFTTERRPEEMVLRCVSNYADIPVVKLTNRTDVDEAMEDGGEVPMIPDWVWSDPHLRPKIDSLIEFAQYNLLFVDWAGGQGYSIKGHLDAEVEKMERQAWNPDVILFDWIGGGLDSTTAGKKDQIRHIYKEAMDGLTDHGKKHDRVVIAFAQLNKSQVKPDTRFVTMDMLGECKTMTDKITNFGGISSLRLKNADRSDKPRLEARQFINMDKATMGPAGAVPVFADFEYQRFKNFRELKSENET